MPDAYDAIHDGLQTVFDTLTPLTRSVTSISLLKPTANADTFTTLLTLTEFWFFKPATTKQNALLQVVRDDATMTTAMASATHVQLGSDIFVIVQSDTLPPSGFDVFWKIFVERFTKRSQIGSLY